jgi:hypothetical protein
MDKDTNKDTEKDRDVKGASRGHGPRRTTALKVTLSVDLKDIESMKRLFVFKTLYFYDEAAC